MQGVCTVVTLHSQLTKRWMGSVEIKKWIYNSMLKLLVMMTDFTYIQVL